MIRAHGMLCVIKVFIVLFLIFIVSGVKAEYEGTWISTDGPYFLKFSLSCDFGYSASDPRTWIGATRDLWYQEGVSHCYLSTDRGDDWEVKRTGAYVRDIQCLPQSADTVWFVADTMDHRYYGNSGVYKSTNGGDNWVHYTVGDDFENAFLTCLDIFEKNGESNTVFVGAYGGPGGENGWNIYYTTDEGQNWHETNGRPSSSAYIRDIIVGPNSSDTIYVAVGEGGGGLYRSVDGGDNWTSLFDAGNIPNCSSLECNCMAISPGNDQRMMIGCKVTISGTTTNRIYYCTDRSNSSPNFSYLNYYMDLDAVDTIKCILINNRSSSECDTFYVAASRTGFYKRMGSGDPENSTPAYFGAHCICDDPNNVSNLFLSTLYGVYYSEDCGSSWTYKPGDEDFLRLISMAVDLPVFYTGGYTHHGSAILKTTNNGSYWEPIWGDIDSINSTQADIVLDRRFSGASQSLWIANYRVEGFISQGHILHSSDAGASWDSSDVTGAMSIAVDMNVGSTELLAGRLDQLPNNIEMISESSDYGSSWNSYNLPNGYNVLAVNKIVYSIKDPDTAYAAGSVYCDYFEDNGGIFRRTDTGENWEFKSSSISSSTQCCLDVEYLTGSYTTIFAASYNGVYKSTNAHQSNPTWTLYPTGMTNANTMCLLAHPTDSTVLYAIAKGGDNYYSYVSADEGRSWINFADGLDGSFRVSELAVDPDYPDTIYAATYEGVYKFKHFVFSGTLPSSETITWGPGTVVINGDLTIPSTSTLNIEEGTKVYAVYDYDKEHAGQFEDRVEIYVYGTLNCIGTGNDSIIFASSNPTPSDSDWAGINIDGGEINLEYTAVQHCKYGLYGIDGSDLNIENCRISRCNQFGVFCWDSELDLDACKIDSIKGNGVHLSRPKRTNITNTEFVNCETYGIYSLYEPTTPESLLILNNDLRFESFTGDPTGIMYGIYINNGHDKFRIHNNTIEDYYQGGIRLLGESCDGQIDSNRILDVTYYGMRISNSAAPTVFNNKIDNNDYGVKAENLALPIFENVSTDPDSGLNSITNSSVWYFINTTGGESDSIEAQYNYWGSADSATVHSRISGYVNWYPIIYEDPWPKYHFENENIPRTLALKQNYPNPFNPVTSIEFALPKQSHAKLSIYNLLGQRIRTLIDESKPAGFWTVVWDGKDSGGNSVSSGIYFYALDTDIGREVKKMTLIK
jgi:parallel beta-helix repeat protein